MNKATRSKKRVTMLQKKKKKDEERKYGEKKSFKKYVTKTYLLLRLA